VDVVIVDSPADVGRAAADVVAELVRSTPSAVLGIATGSSPLTTYAELATRVRNGELSFEHVRAFALDEYVNISWEHPQSYHSVIHREFTVPLGLNPSAVHVPDGQSLNLEQACAAYESAIEEAGGVDLQILGIGRNGHLGFNEPTSSFASRTRVKTLSEQTRRDNARFFSAPEEVPLHCLTQGLGTITSARHLVLVAEGSQKATAVAKAIEGPLSSMCPGSILQLHPRVTVIIDEAAAAELTLTDYYRYAHAHKTDLGQQLGSRGQ
jgi:glucosamine-6-phosphate deaminase